MHGLETIIAMNRKGAPKRPLGLNCCISASPGSLDFTRPRPGQAKNEIRQAGKLKTEDIVKAPKSNAEKEKAISLFI